MFKLRPFLFAAALLSLSLSAIAQVGVGTSSPDPSAQLEIQAIGKGLLIPRMQQADRPAAPVAGLMIYQTDNTPGFYYYNGFAWKMVGEYTESLKYLGKLQVDVGSTGSIVPVAPNTWDTLTWLTPYTDYNNSLQPGGKKIIVPPGVSKVRISARVTVQTFALNASTVSEMGTAHLWRYTPGGFGNTEFNAERLSTWQNFLLFNGWSFGSPLLNVQAGDELGIRWRHNGAAARANGWGSNNNTYLVIEYFQ